MYKFKLQAKIILLIIGLSLLFTLVFTYIQLQNHLEILKSYNSYRMRVGTIIVKTTLEVLLKDMPSPETAQGLFDAAILSFSKEGIADKISIISSDGTALATNDPLVQEFGEAKKDIETYTDLSRSVGKDAWFYSTANAKTRMIDIYIPLYIESTFKYIAKLSFSTANIQKAIADIIWPITLTVVVLAIGNLFIGIFLFRNVLHPINLLNMATKDIASGNLDFKVRIVTRDEIQELGDTFNDMTIALKKMRERAENANPLTKLPGNNIIREEIERRIKFKEKFTVIHADLDNFKAYNDHYGIAKGDDVIRFTSEVLRKACEISGGAKCFLGHEGGDDFIIVTSPDKAQDIANMVISEFESNVRKFYSDTDLKNGYIEEKDRRGSLMHYPIMTISLAGVSNQNRTISSYGELTNIAIEVKRKAKEEMKSVFVLDHRKT